MAKKLAMPVSPDTLLRIRRRRPIPTSPTPRVLGVDDWAVRKRHTHGTILCDLERHQVIDLLPDRSTESLANWLHAHPGVEIITCDRAGFFEKGAATGAPEAIQIANRWHLLTNLREALLRLVQHRTTQIREAETMAASHREESTNCPNADTPQTPVAVEPPREQQAERRRRASQQRREARYQEIMDLKQKGYSLRRIGRELHMSSKTVRRYVYADTCPTRARVIRQNATDPFVDYLRRRRQEGCHSARQLTDEIRRQGFHGSYDLVLRRVRPRRRKDLVEPARRELIFRHRSPNHVAWLLFLPRDEQRDSERRFLDQLEQVSPTLAEASGLA